MEVFISYSREDKALAAEYAARLEAEGFVVWWDIHIPLGETFDRAIENELKRARVALVLWTDHSVQSQWVRAEATAAHESGKLIPVICAPCDLPIQFKHVNALDMTIWRGEPQDPAWKRLVSAIEARAQKTVGFEPSPDISSEDDAASPAYIVAPQGAPQKEFPIMAIAIGIFILVFGGAMALLLAG